MTQRHARDEGDRAHARRDGTAADHSSLTTGGCGMSRRHSATLFGYISREFMVPFCCCIGGFIALFLIADLFEVLQEFLEAKASARTVIAFFALKLPFYVVNVLPMSLLLSSSFMVNILGRHHEITALRASGLSIFRCFLPVWIVALLAAFLSLWLNERIAPQWDARAEEFLEALASPGKPRSASRPKLAYHHAAARRDWLFESFDAGGQQQRVLVKQFRPDRSVAWELRAAKAYHTGGEHGHWVFLDGTHSRFDAAGELPEIEESFTRHEALDLRESPDQIVNSLRPVEELAVGEIHAMLAEQRHLPISTQNVFRTIMWHRLGFPFSCVVAALLGVSLSMTQAGGALKGFAMAVGIMILYYLFSQVLVLLGKAGMVPPVVAGFLPTLLFGGWGGWDLYRKR